MLYLEFNKRLLNGYASVCFQCKHHFVHFCMFPDSFQEKALLHRIVVEGEYHLIVCQDFCDYFLLEGHTLTVQLLNEYKLL